MEKKAIVWKESVYKNDFECICEYKLYDVKKDKINVLIDEFNNLYCPSCKNLVGIITLIDDTNLKKGLQGNYEEYRKKKMS